MSPDISGRAISPPRGAARPTSATETALARAGAGYFEWLDHVWPAAGCSHPVLLTGDLVTLNAATGEVLSSASTEGMPDGIIYKACGNRRVTACPSCAETYRRDAYQLVRSGLIGGKTIPASVAGHPAVFATFTAPSFGAVHTRHVHAALLPRQSPPHLPS